MLRITVRPYGMELWLTTSRRQFTSQRAKYKRTKFDITDTAGSTSQLNDGKIQLVGVFDGKIPTLVHELGHVCINIFMYVGLEINDGTSEAFCYLLDDLYEQCVGEMP